MAVVVQPKGYIRCNHRRVERKRDFRSLYRYLTTSAVLAEIHNPSAISAYRDSKLPWFNLAQHGILPPSNDKEGSGCCG